MGIFGKTVVSQYKPPIRQRCRQPLEDIFILRAILVMVAASYREVNER